MKTKPAGTRVLEVQRWLHGELVVLLPMGTVMTILGTSTEIWRRHALENLVVIAVGLALLVLAFRIKLISAVTPGGRLAISYRRWWRMYYVEFDREQVDVQRARIVPNFTGHIQVPYPMRQLIGRGYLGLLIVKHATGPPTVVRIRKVRKYQAWRDGTAPVSGE